MHAHPSDRRWPHEGFELPQPTRFRRSGARLGWVALHRLHHSGRAVHCVLRAMSGRAACLENNIPYLLVHHRCGCQGVEYRDRVPGGEVGLLPTADISWQGEGVAHTSWQCSN